MKLFVYGLFKSTGGMGSFFLDEEQRVEDRDSLKGVLFTRGDQQPAFYLRAPDDKKKDIIGEVYEVDEDILELLKGNESLEDFHIKEDFTSKGHKVKVFVCSENYTADESLKEF